MNFFNGRSIFIIAEAGVNHNGDIESAKRMVDAAVDAKADAVKFQTFKAEKLVTRNAEKARYQKETTEKNESQFDMLKRLEISREFHEVIMSYCKQKGIMFISTPFDVISADLLESLGVPLYKISSGEITNMPFLKHVARKQKPIILSTGMSTLGEIEEAIQWIYNEGNHQLVLLHCTTGYPASYGSCSLNSINTMRQAFKLPVGYSDHTTGTEISIAAVAMGACVIEKHFTLDKNMEGPDHKASLEPDELKHMIRCIRNVELALGDGIKKATAEEQENLKVIRKSIVAKHPLHEGHVISETDLEYKRPLGGIEPKYCYELIGKKVIRDIEEDEFIRWQDIC